MSFDATRFIYHAFGAVGCLTGVGIVVWTAWFNRKKSLLAQAVWLFVAVSFAAGWIGYSSYSLMTGQPSSN